MWRVTASALMALVLLVALVPGVPVAQARVTDWAEGNALGDWWMPGGWGGMLMMGAAPTGRAALRGCSWGQQTVPGSAIAELPRVTVNIYDGFFVPSEISVRPGTVVIWVNQGSAPHTSTSWDRWDTGILRPGESCATWFVTPGTYQYLSIVAADGGMMTGTVRVEGPPIGGGAPAAPAAPPAPTAPTGPGY